MSGIGKPTCTAIVVSVAIVLAAIFKGCNSSPASPQQTTDRKTYFQAYGVALTTISCSMSAKCDNIVGVNLENNKTGSVIASVSSRSPAAMSDETERAWCLAEGSVMDTHSVLNMSCLQCPAVYADVTRHHPCRAFKTGLPSNVQQQLVCKAFCPKDSFSHPSAVTTTQGVTIECSTEVEPDDFTHSEVTITVPKDATGKNIFEFRSSDPGYDQGLREEKGLGDYVIYVRNLTKSENGIFHVRAVVGLEVTIVSDDPQLQQRLLRDTSCLVRIGKSSQLLVLDDRDKPLAASGNLDVVALSVSITAAVVLIAAIAAVIFRYRKCRRQTRDPPTIQYVNNSQYKKVNK